VAKYMCDGVLIYFGYPQAHEDDAERAVRAGLELMSAMRALKTREPLQTRLGIATGLVVVGDLIGSGEAQERGIVGETPNLAARLQSVAEPNSVVIADSTRKLVGKPVRASGPGSTGPQGHLGDSASLGGTATVFSREPLLSGGKRNSKSCCGAGRRQRLAKDRWCCYPVNRGSASLV
jgi:class 3 adenylate cyclase